MRKIGWHKQANPPSPLADPKVRDATIELEVAKFHQLQQKRQGLSNLTKMLVLVGSLLFFIASYSTILAPYKLVLFIITLLLHESGHIITMKLFGYRDTSLLFLPFLGALAIARKENSTLTEKVWVSLAGPLPGLILGLGLTIAFNLQTSYPEITQTASWRTDFVWLREFSLMLIGLNLFNLLPLYPLDGGQVVNLLLFSPNPYLGVLFKSIGLLFLSLLGLLQPMFLLFAILIALGIPNSFRMAKLSTALRKDMGAIPAGDCAERSAGGDRDSLIRLILARLQHPPYHRLPFGRKYALVVGLLESHRENKAQWPVRVVLSSVYFISLLGGIVGAVCAIIPPDILRSFSPDILRSFVNPKEYSKEYYQKRMKYEINQANQSLKQNPNNSDAYLRRARVRLYLKDIPGVIADTNRVIQLNPTSFMAYQLRGSARQQLGDWQGAQSDTKTARTLVLTQQIQSANRILRNHPQDIEAYLNRADAKLHLKDYQGAIADCNQVLRFNPKSSAALMTRAQVYLQKEDYTKALADANDSLQIKPIPSEAYYLRSQIRQKMGDKQGAISDTQKAYQIDQIEEATQDAQ
jgi:tetratricopeptide (TPR) repeat protein